MAYTGEVIFPLLVLLQVTPAAPAAAPLPIEQIVQRTVDVMERHPERLVCRVSSERQILDGDGNVEEDERAEIEETRANHDVEWKTVRKWKNGREITEETRRDEERKKREDNGKKGKKDDDIMEPFSQKWSSHYSFQFVRQEKLW